jgi:DNA-binding LytR/AlgR family response regulator
MLSLASTGLRCLVVDGNPASRDQLARMLWTDRAVARVYSASDSASALRVLKDIDVDVAFLEVRMSDMDGIELARVLKRFRVPPALVFVTRSPERADEAFRLGAVAYLAKPPRPDHLADSVRRVAAARGAGGHARPRPGAGAPVRPTSPSPERDALAVRVELGATSKLLCGSTVRWAEARGDCVRLHTADGSYVVRARLAALAEDWRPIGLVRIHRSYLAQLRYVTEVRSAGSGRLTVVVDGQPLPVSRRFAPTLRGLLGADRRA